MKKLTKDDFVKASNDIDKLLTDYINLRYA